VPLSKSTNPRKKPDTPKMQINPLTRTGKHLSLDNPKSVKYLSRRRPLLWIGLATIYTKIQKFLRTAWTGQLYHLCRVQSESGGVALEGVIACQFPRSDLTKDDSQGKHVCGKIEFLSYQNLWGHVRICATEGESLGFFGVSCGDTGKAKIGYFETCVGGDEEVFAFEIAVDAAAGVEVGEGAGYVGCEGDAETPGKGPGCVVDVGADVATFDVF